MPRTYASPVVFCGENPGLTLYNAAGDQVVLAASYWRCTYSPHGEGNVLIIWGAAPTPWQAIYADNLALGRFVTDTFTQHFGDFQGRGFSETAPQLARFFQESDSRYYHRVACHGEDRLLGLTWRDIRDRQLIRATEMSLGPNTFELATVICPCDTATVTIDGTAVEGVVRPGTDPAGRPRSSAFLAFAESWVQHETPPAGD